MEQRELVERLLRRDETGMEELLRHYGPLMKYVIAPILPDPRDREDCLSEAALRVWERIGQFDGERGSWAAWLTALTRNTALNRARSNARHGGEALSEQTPSQEPGPEETVLQRERRAALCPGPAAGGVDQRPLLRGSLIGPPAPEGQDQDQTDG